MYSILGTIFLMMGLSHVAVAEVIALTPEQTKAMAIEVAVVEKAEAVTEARYNAVVVLPPHQLHLVSAPQSGLIDRMTISTGQKVKKGQVLVHLASDSLVTLQSEYLQTLTNTQLAMKALKRDEALFKEGIIAERRYLETQSNYQALASALAEKKQMLSLSGMSKQAIASLGSQQKLRQGLTLTAPVSGYVIEQLANVGQRVEASTPLYKIAELNPLWLTLNVPVEQAMHIKEGMSLEVPGQAISGKVISKLRTVDKHTQSQEVRAEVANGSELLALDQFVEVIVKQPKQSQQAAFRLPSQSLVHRGSLAYVFKKVSQGFESVPVQVVGQTTSGVLVMGQLHAEDEVVVKGIAALKGSWLGIGDE